MRIEVTEEGVDSGTWFEITEKWTRGQAKELEQATIRQIFDDWLPERVIAMNVILSTGEVITDPSQIYFEAEWLDDLDQRVYGIMANMLYKAMQTLFFSATGSVSISLNGRENKASKKLKG